MGPDWCLSGLFTKRRKKYTWMQGFKSQIMLFCQNNFFWQTVSKANKRLNNAKHPFKIIQYQKSFWCLWRSFSKCFCRNTEFLKTIPVVLWFFLSQEVCSALLCVLWAYNAGARPGRDCAYRGPGSWLPRAVLPLWGTCGFTKSQTELQAVGHSIIKLTAWHRGAHTHSTSQFCRAMCDLPIIRSK